MDVIGDVLGAPVEQIVKEEPRLYRVDARTKVSSEVIEFLKNQTKMYPDRVDIQQEILLEMVPSYVIQFKTVTDAFAFDLTFGHCIKQVYDNYG